MYDDISEDTRLYFDELDEREAIEEQWQKIIEENMSSLNISASS